MDSIDKSTGKDFFCMKTFVPVLHNEEGMVLIVSMALMLVITVMGVLALSTSTTDVMVAGNQRLREINMANSEGGKQVSKPIIEDFANDGILNNAALGIVVQDPNLGNEIEIGDSDLNGLPNKVSDNPLSTVDATNNPDIQFALQDVTVTVDIDLLGRKRARGGGIEFAAGAEGLGNKTVVRYYKVNSISRGQVGSEAVVGALYRNVKD